MDNPTTNTQQKTLDDLEYYQALEEKRRQINKERCDAMEPMYTERFNIDTYMALALKEAEAHAEVNSQDEEAFNRVQRLHDEIPTMSIEEKLEFIDEDMYYKDSKGYEEKLRSLNIITPYETQLRLAYVLDRASG